MARVTVEEQPQKEGLEVEHSEGGYVCLSDPGGKFSIDLHVEGTLTVKWVGGCGNGK